MYSLGVSQAEQLPRYRRFHEATVPGMADLHRMVRSIFDAMLSDGAEVLVCGAGGGRELVTLGESERSYRLVGIDTCADMIGLARHALAGTSAEGRTNFIQAAPEDLPRQIYDAATSLFVMHFLPDDGAKTTYLAAIRQRLRPGAPYLHVDACYPGAEMYDRLRPIYERHARLGGLSPEVATEVSRRVAELPIISEHLLAARLHEAGFRVVSPFYRGLWYTGFWTEAA